MNMIEKILARASGRKEVAPGEVVTANVNLMVMHDLSANFVTRVFREELGVEINCSVEDCIRLRRVPLFLQRVRDRDGALVIGGRAGKDDVRFFHRSANVPSLDERQCPCAVHLGRRPEVGQRVNEGCIGIQVI